jgi:hypothetical protein
MVHPWDQNQGHDRKEGDDAYRLFLIYLRLGIERSINKLSEITGQSYHNLYGKLTRFCWKERSTEFDKWKELGNDATQYEVDLPPPPEPIELVPVKVFKSSAPTKQVNDEIIRERLDDLGGLVHKEKMQEFAVAYEHRGRKVFETGNDMLSLMNYYLIKIKESTNRQSLLLERNDFANYLKECTATDLLVGQYCKLWRSFEVADERARADWGDAIGVSQLLEAMYRTS